MIEFSGSFRNIMICNIIILYRDTQKRNLVPVLDKIQVNQTHITAIENQQTVLVDQIVLQTHIILLTTQDTNIVEQMTIQIIVSKVYTRR